MNARGRAAVVVIGVAGSSNIPRITDAAKVVQLINAATLQTSLKKERLANSTASNRGRHFLPTTAKLLRDLMKAFAEQCR